MLNLPVHPAVAEKVGAARFMPVVGDSMEPTLRAGDLVAVAPTDSFRGDGLYVLDMIGKPDVCRVIRSPSGGMILVRDNSRYRAYELSAEQFNEKVVAQVFATCHVIEHSLARSA